MTKTEMNKCKYCNSGNLILEPQVKGQDVMTANVVALKCGDCGKWLKWCPKDERKYHFQAVKQNKEYDEQTKQIDEQRKQAVKEFAEKLKIALNSCIVEINVDGFIDDLLKEYEK